MGPGAADNRNPQWNRDTATCSGSWCHGPQDIFNTSPGWTNGTGTLTCTSCHGMPPAAPHPADPRCSNCHVDIDGAGNITDRSLHVNGEVDFK
jgi:predicted CxxxxCH...CXXCH cytochrome family protein